MVLWWCRASSYVQWGGCNYLRYRTKYEVEIPFVNLSDTYNTILEYYHASVIIDH